jgi:hypothetical protein
MKIPGRFSLFRKTARPWAAAKFENRNSKFEKKEFGKWTQAAEILRVWGSKIAKLESGRELGLSGKGERSPA